MEYLTKPKFFIFGKAAKAVAFIKERWNRITKYENVSVRI